MITRSGGFHRGRHGMQPRAQLAGWWQWEAFTTHVARAIEHALSRRDGRRVRWAWPESSPWPRQTGGSP